MVRILLILWAGFRSLIAVANSVFVFMFPDGLALGILPGSWFLCL